LIWIKCGDQVLAKSAANAVAAAQHAFSRRLTQVEVTIVKSRAR
jgi:1,2-phenylacetyl-CoA epoxidase PaaB subunit